MADKGGKKYGLILKKKPSTVQIKPSIFGGDDSGDEEDSSRKNVNTTIRKEAEKKKQMRQTQLEMDKVLEDDPTAYEYDAVYDKMAERKANLLAAKTAKADKKPKYISNLLKFAETRKKEEERRVERQVQKEREAEGSEYADKDAFVTSAFRRKMQEMAEEEERQRKRDEMDGDVTKQADLSKFYRNLLDRNVSSGGAFDTERQMETHEDDTMKSRHSPSPEKEGRIVKKGERTQRTSGHESKRRDYKEEDTTSTDRYERGKERTGEDDMDKKRKTHSHNATRECEDRTREVPENDRERKHDKRHQNEKERDSERDEDAKRKTGESQGHETRKSLDGETNSEERSCENIVVKETEEKLREKDKEEKHAVNKFAKHSSQETVMSARERFLARKKTRVIVTQTGSDEEN